MFLFAISIASATYAGSKDETVSKPEKTSVITLTQETFKETITKGVVIVDFWATWCGPCRMQGPVIETIEKKYHRKITVGKVDVDKNTFLSQLYNVSTIPTLLIFKDGTLKQRFVGYTQQVEIEKIVNELL
jgi:thioredoxin 1